MKKVFAIMLAAVMAISLFGCGSTDTADDSWQDDQNGSISADDNDEASEAESEIEDDVESVNEPEGSEEPTDAESSSAAEPAGGQAEKHIYDNAEVRPVMNGYGTEKIGEYSVISAGSKDCTEEALADWYYNYIAVNDFNYCLIVYSDNEEKGCYGTMTAVEKDVTLEKEDDGDYILGSEDGATAYGPSDDGKSLINLKESLNATETSGDFVSDVEKAVDGTVGDGEKITGVSLDGKTLTVSVDFSNASFDQLTPEMLAESRVGSITEEILAMNEYDDQWDTIVIDFGEYGKASFGKDDIVDGGYGRYFDTDNFALQK